MNHTNGYKLLVTYNYLSHRELEYRRFMIQRWIPAMQELGLEPGDVLHTMYGDYPRRLVVLYAPNLETLQRALESEAWQQWHERMLTFVRNLDYRVVPARPWLQF
ncbi:MAG: hypothetical protein D6775_01955 [Caldilineae bacterium]|nr:MAG: hypothetical protein D6775_01955 [Caldilineae bacterium]